MQIVCLIAAATVRLQGFSADVRCSVPFIFSLIYIQQQTANGRVDRGSVQKTAILCPRRDANDTGFKRHQLATTHTSNHHRRSRNLQLQLEATTPVHLPSSTHAHAHAHARERVLYCCTPAMSEPYFNGSREAANR